jgi:hypothetical protein
MKVRKIRDRFDTTVPDEVIGALDLKMMIPQRLERSHGRSRERV